jgi:glycosyltransferase involved in cell wall biosynthesis
LLREEPIEFTLVGPIQISVPADLTDRRTIRWIGPVSRENTAQFYSEADIFLFPTFSDGFGLTQLEAQAWQLPIVATQFCGEVVEHGKNGLVLPENSPGAIAEALRGFCADPTRLEKMSRRSGLTERFSLGRIGKQWLHVFD